MELLHTLGIDWKYLLGQVINFLIVLFVLKKYAFGPIVETLAKRTATLEQGLRDATAAKAARTSGEQEKAAVIAAARAEAGNLLQDTRAQAEEMRLEMLTKAKNDVEDVVQLGKERLVMEKEQMLAAAKGELAELVVAAVHKISPRVFTEKDEVALFHEAAAVLQKKNRL
jgi:F-type H+-transporting ATPase subunit b